MRIARHALIATVSAVAALTTGAGCSGTDPTSGFDGGGARSDSGVGGPGPGMDGSSTVPLFGDGSSTNPNDGGNPSACSGLQCQIHPCSGGGSTTISGTIYDPAGKNPLYDVVAYVPNKKPDALTSGASCDSCGSLYTGVPIATALTDAAGKFVIKNAPDGTNIPLVLQVGKWRRQITIPSVKACTDNAQPDKTLTLPKNRAQGDIPLIAISTGSADTLECLLSRVGLDSAEYGPGGQSSGRIQIFQGSGGPNTFPPGPSSPQSLWDTKADLMKYDIVLLSCEGSETTQPNRQALFDYTAAGGRVFASHFHYAWFNASPFAAANLATWSPGTNDTGVINATIVTTLPNGQPFAKGKALSQWLMNVSALTNGELPIQDSKHNADVGVANTPSQSWIVADMSSPVAGATEYFSFNTPTSVPAAQQCGRVVYSDLHVGAASGDFPLLPTPTGCANKDLSPQEKALEFMLFDLSSCVTPNDMPPQPPPPKGAT